MTLDAELLHNQAIIIDACCPVIDAMEHLDLCIKGGLTAVAPSVASIESPSVTLRKIGRWIREINKRDDLLLVRTAGDILKAKREGKLGIIMHFQGTDPLEDKLDYLDAYKALGVGVIQLAYNTKNRIGDGCEELVDSGVSRLGVRMIKRMNEIGVIVDCSHTGERTTLDAINLSTAPVVVTHANAKALQASPRNLSDTVIKEIAASGGVVGAVSFPGFISPDTRPSLDQFVDHIAYMADLVGIDHVGLGLDHSDVQFPFCDDEYARRIYVELLEDGTWSTDSYPEPPYYGPVGLETPADYSNLTVHLLKRGFSHDDVEKVMGQNWMRVYRAVWGE